MSQTNTLTVFYFELSIGLILNIFRLGYNCKFYPKVKNTEMRVFSFFWTYFDTRSHCRHLHRIEILLVLKFREGFISWSWSLSKINNIILYICASYDCKRKIHFVMSHWKKLRQLSRDPYETVFPKSLPVFPFVNLFKVWL